ncbi:T4SS-associated protein EirA [Candidatus Synchoanobacter obligatus]|uniref:T4SS-associated protein EirA n=1 Tax=Candidatus Synchoanobacter obligatus TaxID=2919597 RepID=A0ABT1L5V1_9GAMM|nr:T4SS-associated protein EirA [Candidatus Synchoanobacter obligatus]MCP8352291.1 T4SS-associated protein EirA [Candidatus Synchoanobacter obligatus]
MRRFLHIGILIGLSSSAFAWDLFSSPPPKKKVSEDIVTIRPGPPPTCLPKKQQEQTNRYTCPSAKELYRSGMKWKTDSGWQSFQESFSEGISHFKGAQWKGIGVGRIYCIYQPSDPTEFPVQLTISPLISQPTTAYWEDVPSRSILNCLSPHSDPCDCQFSYYIDDEEVSSKGHILDIEKQ